MAGEGEWTQAQTRPTAWGYSDFLWDPEGLLHICTVTCPESKSRPHFHQELPQVPPRASRLWWQVAFQGQHRREPWVSPGRRPPAIWAGNPGSQFRGVWYRKFSPALSGPQIPHLMGRGTHQTSSRAGLSKVQGLPEECSGPSVLHRPSEASSLSHLSPQGHRKTRTGNAKSVF